MGLQAEEFYTPAQVAKALHVSLETVRRWIRGGKLPVLRMGSRYRIRGADLLAKIREIGQDNAGEG